MIEDSVSNGETITVDQLIAYQVTLIDRLRQDLSKSPKNIESELRLLRELTAAIVSLRELREMSFNRQRFLHR
jgi:hypothetical protein